MYENWWDEGSTEVSGPEESLTISDSGSQGAPANANETEDWETSSV